MQYRPFLITKEFVTHFFSFLYLYFKYLANGLFIFFKPFATHLALC